MSEKQEIIQQMLALQKRFIEIEHAGEFSAEQYYDADSDTELARHKRDYNELAMKLVDLAHAEKGSRR